MLGRLRSFGQVVGRDGAEVATVGGAGPKAPLLRGAQTVRAPQPRHPVPAAPLARAAQDHGDPGAAVTGGSPRTPP